MAFGKPKRLSEFVAYKEDHYADGRLRGWLFTDAVHKGDTVGMTPAELANLPQVAALLEVAREVIGVDKILQTASMGDLEPLTAKARDALEPFDAR